MSEAAKILPKIQHYLGEDKRILDIGCGDGKVVPHAIGVDGRDLPGVNIVTNDFATLWDTQTYGDQARSNDVVFSSHYLEHSDQPFYLLECWSHCLKPGGHLILYMPDKHHYDSKENPEHLYDWSYDDFLFAFRRIMCGEGKNFKGEHLPKVYDLIEHGMHVGENLYSFYIVARKV
jgi:predicted SAM-dependent methyltransferase